MKHYRYLLPLVLWAGILPAGAQQSDSRKMTLEELFALAETNSKSQKLHDLKIDQTRQAIREAKSERLPRIEASLAVSYLGDGRIWDRDFSNPMKAEIPHFGNNFAMTASELLYGGGAVKSGIEIARLNQEKAETEKLRDKNDLHFLLAGYYLDLYKIDNQIQVYDKNIALTEELIASISARHQQGTALENDITRYELQSANCKLAKTRLENERHIVNYRLNILVGLDAQTILVPSVAADSPIPASLSSSAYLQQAQRNAPQMRSAGLNILQSRQRERMVRSAALPKLALVAQEHLDGPVTIEIPALNNNFNYWFVGASLRYDLASLYKNKSRTAQARLETRQRETELELLKDRLAWEVEADCTRYILALEETETLRKNVLLAHENYRIVHTRYTNGLTLATDMLSVSNERLEAEVRLANAQANALFCYYKLRHTCGIL